MYLSILGYLLDFQLTGRCHQRSKEVKEIASRAGKKKANNLVFFLGLVRHGKSSLSAQQLRVRLNCFYHRHIKKGKI